MPAGGIEWSEGWPRIEAVIHRLIARLEDGTPLCISADDYMTTYQIVYDMCVQHRPRAYTEALYDSYRKSIEGYSLSSALPAFIGKHGEFLLSEFVRRWSNHNELVKWLSRFFAYLERFYLAKKKLPSLNVTGQLIFLDAVYEKVKDQLRVAILSMIRDEREGCLIDGVLLKNVLDIYVCMGNGGMKIYEQDFEKPMLSDTVEYYSQKAGKSILACSFSDYMHEANECMRHEEERAHRYFQNCSKQQLLEVVYHELFVVHTSQLEEKRQYDALASEEVVNQWLAQRCKRLAL